MAFASLCRFLRSISSFGVDGSVSYLCLFVGCSPLHNTWDGVIYGRAKVRSDPSRRSYAQDLELGCRAAAEEARTEEERIAYLLSLWRYTLLRCSLNSQADNYLVEAFQLLLLLGQVSKAVGLAELLTDPA